MKQTTCLLLLLLCLTSCMDEGSPETSEGLTEAESAMDSLFDEDRWKIKEGADYPYRDEMLHDLVYEQQLKGLEKEELIKLLGEPDRSKKGFLYYRVAQKRLGLLPLHTTTLVIELSEDSIVKTRRIHE